MLVLGSIIISSVTKTSFAMNITDGQAGDEFFVSQYYTPGKPVRTADVTLTDAATTVEFTGLTPNCQYFVCAFRGDVEAVRDDLPGWFHNYNGWTLPDRITQDLATTKTVDYSTPLGNFFKPEGAFTANFQPEILTVDGETFLRLHGEFHDNPDSTENYYGLRSDFSINPDVAASYTTWMRWHGDTGEGIFTFCSTTFCTDMQAQYNGLCSSTDGNYLLHTYGGGGSHDSFESMVADTKYDVRIDYNPDTLTMDFYVKKDGEGNWVYTHTDTLPGKFTGPMSIWLCHSFKGAGACYVDYGPVNVTANFGVVGYTSTKWIQAKGDATVISGTESGWSDLTPGIPIPYGGVTARDSSERDIVYPYMTTFTPSWKAGTTYKEMPPVFPAEGKMYKTLHLIANQQGDGKAIARLYDYGGVLIPDTIVPGNSLGFRPFQYLQRLVDISAVAVDMGVTVRAIVTNNTEGASTAPIFITAWFEFQDYVAPTPIIPPNDGNDGGAKVIVIFDNAAATDKVIIQNTDVVADVPDVDFGKYLNIPANPRTWDTVVGVPGETYRHSLSGTDILGARYASILIPAPGRKLALTAYLVDTANNIKNPPLSFYVDVAGAEITKDEYDGVAKEVTVLTRASQASVDTLPTSAAAILPFQGSVSYGGAVSAGSKLVLFAGDTPPIRIAILQNNAAMDLSGWTVMFSAKRRELDAEYAIAPRDITGDVEAPNVVLVQLAHADTKDLPEGDYLLDVEISKDDEVYVASRITLRVKTSTKRGLGVTLTPSADTGAVGQATTFTAAGFGGSGDYLYEFWRLGPGTSGAYVKAQDYSASPTLSWSPAAGDVGSNEVIVWMKESGSATATYDVKGEVLAFEVA